MGKLRKITQKELEKIIENHKHWLKEDCVGWESMKATLSNTDLSNLKLVNGDLRGIDFNNANFSKTDFRGTMFVWADLSNANLMDVNLRGADLSYADLRFADLSNANLMNANFYKTNLYKTNLSGAKIENVNIYEACLFYAKIDYPLSCPVDGAFIAWKKADGKIVKLQILEDSKRLSATTSKCRCDKALVLEIQDLEGNKLDIESVRSDYDASFIYKVGEIVCVNDFNENRWNECSTGIHFFVDRRLAVNYW